MTLNLDNFRKKFGKNIVTNESLAKYNWFNIGGNAEILFKPDSLDQLIDFREQANKDNLSLSILGAGSNVLIRDKGIKGAVIKLGSKFSEIKLVEENMIEVGAGAFDRKLSDFATDNMISKMEFLSCIPGSIGGAVIMNSGCYGSDVSQILENIKVLDNNAKTKIIDKDEIKFHYRGSNLPKDYIILSATFRGVLSSKTSVKMKQDDLIKRKKISQPSRVKTGGSTFKNTPQKKAWQLIKDSGCDRFFVGDAKISEQHCNFFINNGKASATDLENLIKKVKNEVKIKTGTDLELEIKIIGDEI